MMERIRSIAGKTGLLAGWRLLVTGALLLLTAMPAVLAQRTRQSGESETREARLRQKRGVERGRVDLEEHANPRLFAAEQPDQPALREEDVRALGIEDRKLHPDEMKTEDGPFSGCCGPFGGYYSNPTQFGYAHSGFGNTAYAINRYLPSYIGTFGGYGGGFSQAWNSLGAKFNNLQNQISIIPNAGRRAETFQDRWQVNSLVNNFNGTLGSLGLGSYFNPWQSPYGLSGMTSYDLGRLINPWDGFGFSSLQSVEDAGEGVSSDLNARFSSLGRQHDNFLYNDPTLTGLRDEYNRFSLLLYHNDPYLLFWSYELDTLLDEIYQGSPYYPAFAALAEEVESWKTPPVNIGLLKSRYDKRLAMMTLSSQVQQESHEYIRSDYGLNSWVNAVASAVSSRMQSKGFDPNALLYQGYWNQRWQNTYLSSAEMNRISQGFNQLVEDTPDLKTHLQSRIDLVSLMNCLKDDAEAKRVGELMSEVPNDPEVISRFYQLYEQYLDRINQLYNSTDFKAEVERFHEALNGRVQYDWGYRQVQSQQYLFDELKQFRRRIHDAMLKAWNNGNRSNPYYDWRVQSLYDNRYSQVVSEAARVMSASYKFDLDFLSGPVYANLESETRQRLAAAIAPVINDLKAAQDQFAQDVSLIPQLREVEQARAALPAALSRINPRVGELVNQVQQSGERLSRADGRIR